MLLPLLSSASAALALASAQPAPIGPPPIEVGRAPVTNAPATTEVPWSVRLEFSPVSGSGGSTCTGSALTAHWILTAAHCLRGKSIQNTEVKVSYVDDRGVQRTAYSKGRASYYNHPHYGGTSSERIIGDRSDDIGLIRLYDAGMVPELNATIYSGNQKPWDWKGTPHGDAYVAGYGWGTDPTGAQRCAEGTSDFGTKRLGRVALTGDHDDDGIFGTGPTIGVQASRKYGTDLCGGDSGAAWSILRWGKYLLFAVHSGNHQSLSWSDLEWAAVVRPKMDWIIRTTRAKGLPIECSGPTIWDRRETLLEASYMTCREVN